MDLSVNYSNAQDKGAAYAAVKEAVTPELLAKFQVKAEIEYFADEIKAKGKGFDLSLKFTDKSCDAKLELSFLLKPLKGRVLEGIEKQLKRVV